MIVNREHRSASRLAAPFRALLVISIGLLLIVACAQPPQATTGQVESPAAASPAPESPAAASPAPESPAAASPAPESPAAESPAAASPAAESPAAASRSMTIGMNELVTSLDPPTDWAIAATWIHMNIFDCLVWRNRETADFEPWLATSWENVDERTWRFPLREGVTFHNGEPFNAEAVKYTYERILADETMITHRQWTFIDQIEALDEYEVEIRTVDPEPAMLSKMSGTGCGIQAPGHGEEAGREGVAQNPVGTGPFKFVEWVRDDHITLAANEDYWQGKPAVDTIVFRAIPEATTRVSSLIAGEVDLMVSVPAQDIERVNATDGIEVKEFLTTQVMMLAMRAGPNDRRLERADLGSAHPRGDQALD
jgi:peptide/nickel transport system substrate-binding protein